MTNIEVVVPTKPWRASNRERLTDVVIFLASITTSYGVVALTPMKGKLA